MVVERGVVTVVGQAARLATGPDVLDLGGRFVLRGLWDHHVHLDQWALARRRLDLSGCLSAAQCCDVVRRRLVEAPPPAGQPLVGQGYRRRLWPDAPDLRAMDEAAGGVPVVLVAHDLHTGWLSTAAFGHYGLPTDPSGLLREGALHTLIPRLGQVPVSVLDGWVADACRAAATRGVTGVVDFEMADNLGSWSRRAARGPAALRVEAAVYPEHLPAVLAGGLRTGDRVPGSGGLVTVGSLKVFVDGSLNARTAHFGLALADELLAWVGAGR